MHKEAELALVVFDNRRPVVGMVVTGILIVAPEEVLVARRTVVIGCERPDLDRLKGVAGIGQHHLGDAVAVKVDEGAVHDVGRLAAENADELHIGAVIHLIRVRRERGGGQQREHHQHGERDAQNAFFHFASSLLIMRDRGTGT